MVNCNLFLVTINANLKDIDGQLTPFLSRYIALIVSAFLSTRPDCARNFAVISQSVFGYFRSAVSQSLICKTTTTLLMPTILKSYRFSPCSNYGRTQLSRSLHNRSTPSAQGNNSGFNIYCSFYRNGRKRSG